MQVHPSALKHGILEEDIQHAVRNAMAIDELDDDLRLYLGPNRSGSLLEVITLFREGEPRRIGDPRHDHATEVPPTLARE